ncbi:MAG: low molecular weight protein-tyrosine-phosphatase [Pseudomonadota bacterium]
MPRLLFVCLGNICRSPAADGIARSLAAQRGLDWRIDSAGTGGWHVGDPPDARMVAAAAGRGIDLSPLRARQAEADDFLRFDHIFAMDENNLADLEQIRPPDAQASLNLFLPHENVPDPYYGGPDGFERVLDLVSNRMETLFETLAKA